MTDFISHPVSRLSGIVCVPGDKSISHRSLMLGSIATGATHVTGFLPGEDNRATLQIMRALGVKIDEYNKTELVIHGVGMYGLQAPRSELDCGNAGTAIRLLVGLLVGQMFDCILTGDQYLLKRPMRRVTDPLTLMGAKIGLTAAGTAPLHIHGGVALHGIIYELPIPSAQIKSCLLLAGMYANGVTTVIESGITRDHTERMLTAMNYPVETDGAMVSLTGEHHLQGCDITIPADISSAAFFMVAAAITPQSEITLTQVGINPTRDGVLQILELMGATITIRNRRQFGGEPVADITIVTSQLRGIEIPQHLVPLAIDELPVLMIAAACAKGITVLKGASELRVKETDRIAAMANGLIALGIDVHTFEDGMQVRGGTLQGGEVNSCGDHRIAMAFAVAGLMATSAVKLLMLPMSKRHFPVLRNWQDALVFY